VQQLEQAFVVGGMVMILWLHPLLELIKAKHIISVNNYPSSIYFKEKQMRRLLYLTLVAVGLPIASWSQELNPAINTPDKFAWETFVSINKPVTPGGNTATWESWINEEDVYADPNHIPTWPAQQLLAQQLVKRLKPITQLRIQKEEVATHNKRLHIGETKTLLVAPLQGGAEEVRMNKSTFGFIVENKLWYIEGQVDAFYSYQKTGKTISFPTGSKEIKAIWKPITEEQKPRFHWASNPSENNKTYGLVAIHIISKDLPNWTWATFEQIDNPERCKILGCNDGFGTTESGNLSPELTKMFADAGLGPEWKYYRLDGTQTNFTDAQGRPTLLGNSVTEDGFVPTSSCITCHARSTIGPPVTGETGANRLSVFDPTNPNQSNNGTPDPKWYYKDPKDRSTVKYVQLDFLWSLQNANHRTQ
jgi:hypothetical protein